MTSKEPRDHTFDPRDPNSQACSEKPKDGAPKQPEEPHLLERVKHKATEAGDIIVINTPGMRILKSSIAVILCFIIDTLRFAPNLYDSTIATIVCLQNDIRSSWATALNRIIATTVAGIYAAVFLEIVTVHFGIPADDIRYLLLVGVFIIPLMQILVLIHRKASVSLAAIVFILVTVTSTGMTDPIAYVTNRVINTIVGILVALAVNWFPPFNRLGQKLDRVRDEAQQEYELLREREGVVHPNAKSEDANSTHQDKKDVSKS